MSFIFIDCIINMYWGIELNDINHKSVVITTKVVKRFTHSFVQPILQCMFPVTTYLEI